MKNKPITFQIGDYKTLPCRFIHGRVIGDVPSYMPEFPFRAEYDPPSHGVYPFELSRDCLHRASEDAQYAIDALSQWSVHLSDIGYFVQFQDDLQGRMIGRLHSHTELASAILTERLRMNDRPLFESYQEMRQFRWVQEQYRADPQRDQRYNVYEEKLDRIGKKGDHKAEAGLIIHRALKYIALQKAEWPTLPPILNIRQDNKKPGDLISVFVSYSHRDERLVNELAKHLSGLEKSNLINPWNDRQIGAGEEWQGQIDENLKAADIILLLISADFLASRYCYDVEMQEAMKLHENGSARVIPVILRPCVWDDAPFAKLLALPTDGKPVTTWGNEDEAFADVTKGIRNAVNRVRLSRS